MFHILCLRITDPGFYPITMEPRDEVEIALTNEEDQVFIIAKNFEASMTFYFPNYTEITTMTFIKALYVPHKNFIIKLDNMTYKMTFDFNLFVTKGKMCDYMYYSEGSTYGSLSDSNLTFNNICIFPIGPSFRITQSISSNTAQMYVYESPSDYISTIKDEYYYIDQERVFLRATDKSNITSYDFYAFSYEHSNYCKFGVFDTMSDNESYPLFGLDTVNYGCTYEGKFKQIIFKHKYLILICVLSTSFIAFVTFITIYAIKKHKSTININLNLNEEPILQTQD